jgi:hypothetical protein
MLLFHAVQINSFLPHFPFQENNRVKELDLSNNEFSEIGGQLLGPAIGRSYMNHSTGIYSIHVL